MPGIFSAPQLSVQPNVSVGTLQATGPGIFSAPQLSVQPNVSVGTLQHSVLFLYADVAYTDKVLILQSFLAQAGRSAYFCNNIPTAVYVNNKLTRVQIIGQTIKFYSLPPTDSEIIVLFNNITLTEGTALTLYTQTLRGNLIAETGLELSLDNVTFSSAIQIATDEVIYLRPSVSAGTEFINKVLSLESILTQEIINGPFTLVFDNNKDATVTVSGLAQGIEYYEV